MFPPLLSHTLCISHFVILTPLNETKIFVLPTYTASTWALASNDFPVQIKQSFCLTESIYPIQPMDVTHPCVIWRTCRINQSWVLWPNGKAQEARQLTLDSSLPVQPCFPTTLLHTLALEDSLHWSNKSVCGLILEQPNLTSWCAHSSHYTEESIEWWISLCASSLSTPSTTGSSCFQLPSKLYWHSKQILVSRTVYKCYSSGNGLNCSSALYVLRT